MAYISLEQAKKHCNIDECFTGDDQYISDLIAVAEAVLEEDICHKLSSFETNGVLPPALSHALLLLIGNYYANREPVIIGTIVADAPLSYKHLVGLYRDYLG
jgi:uncharacterized phage protein (predicted DNA packaging)